MFFKKIKDIIIKVAIAIKNILTCQSKCSNNRCESSCMNNNVVNNI